MKFHGKGFVSLLSGITFFLLGFSGLILFVTPRGRVANWTGWTILGLEKHDWQAVHINLALLFLIVAGLHLYLNWGVFWCFLKKKGRVAVNLKLEILAAALIGTGVFAGAALHLPPFNSMMAYNYRIKDYWDRWSTQAPQPHAEELTLEQFASKMGLSVKDVIHALEEEGIHTTDGTARLDQLAEDHGISPSEVYAAISKHFPEASPGAENPRANGGTDAVKGKDGGGKGRGMGQGRAKGRGMGWHSAEE